MPQKLKYKLEETFTPPEPHSQPKRYCYKYTEIRYAYFDGEVEADSIDEVYRMFEHGQLDGDCYDDDLDDRIDFEVEEL